jgi:hypothetical protein
MSGIGDALEHVMSTDPAPAPSHDVPPTVEAYERAFRDALAEKPGSGVAPLPVPGSKATLPREMIDAMRRVMAQAAPAEAPAESPPAPVSPAAQTLRPNPFSSPGAPAGNVAPATPPAPLQSPSLGASDAAPSQSDTSLDAALARRFG